MKHICFTTLPLPIDFAELLENPGTVTTDPTRLRYLIFQPTQVPSKDNVNYL